jgi:dipeptidyl aminopeptidase/acylaminoacyl peptidase
MKNSVAVFILLTATLLFAGCQQTDLPEESAVLEDNSGQEIALEILDELPEEWTKLVVVYEKDGRIMLVEGDNPPRALTEGPKDSNPLLSPDGKHVLFAVTYHDEREGFDGNYEGDYYDLWLAELDNGTTKPFVTEEMLRPAKDLPIGKELPWLVTERITWLNSGNKIAFKSYAIAHVWNIDHNDLWIADLVTGEVIEFLPNDMGGSFAFSPDDELLIVANETSVSIMSADGSQRLEILSFESFGAEYESNYVPQPVWAPDSSYGLVALLNPESYYPYNHFEYLKSADSFQEAGNVEIWIFYRDGSTEKLFNIHWPTVDELMTGNIFSPDRRYIISSLKNKQVSESRLIDLEETIVATYNYASQLLSWSMDSQALILKDSEIFLVGVDGRQISLPYTLQYIYPPNSATKWISPTAFVIRNHANDSNDNLWLVDVDGRTKLIDKGVGNVFDALLIK